LEKIAEYALDVARKLKVQYADIRIIDSVSESIETKNHDVAAVDLGSSTGAGIRVLADGGWGFTCTQDLRKL